MAQTVLNALSAGEQVILLLSKVPGRNVQVHPVGHGKMEEITRWILYVQARTIGTREIACMYHARNLQEKWTIRYDWRLPAPGRGVDYPFCVPVHWWKGNVNALRTIRSKPAFVDRFGNGWVVPSESRHGHHWDVHIMGVAQQQNIGLNELNVVAHGAPQDQGHEGALHHLTKSKHPHFSGGRWQC
ncbi:MAG: hypothetical protein HQM05_09560 [Magnetococcales bacterium]|nr:hypothetical protein [Magnetococcales bacterium]